MIQEKERLTPVGQLENSYINYNGSIVNPGISGFIVVKYQVTPGDKLTIHATLHAGTSYSYAFYNSSAFSSATVVSVGPSVTSSTDDMDVTVPSGATYLGVQKFNSEEYVDKAVEISFKDINKLSQKSSVAGTEKIPVSDTEYITTQQIVAGVEAQIGDIETILSSI